MEKMTVKCCWIDPDNTDGLELPVYETELSAGMDIRIAVRVDLTLQPGDIVLLPTNLSFAIPDGFEMQVRPRSGLAVKHGITLINSPGTIDADYRGEVKIGLVNHGRLPYTFKRGDRVAQLVLKTVMQARLDIVLELDETDRGDGGFGHTGVSS